jgi:site-specific DNA recombinase
MTQLRAVIYARYSSDLQREESIEDQLRLCRERAAAEGWIVVECYSDMAQSGSTSFRPRYQQMLSDARSGKFDIVLAESLDRLSRDQENVAGLYKALQFKRIQLVTVGEGLVSELHIGLKGTMNALFIKDLAAKTHRGMQGRIEAGRSAGSISFGYRVRREFDAQGEPIRGGREIVPQEATLVIKIFEMLAVGRSPRDIARALNRDHVAGPRGREWRDTTIRGHGGRGTGILRNELYIGRLVWNRQTFVRDPSTGKRLSRANPRDQWIEEEVPELRIVPQQLWDKVQARLLDLANSPTSKAIKAGQFWLKRRPRHILTGLVACGHCGDSMAVIGKDYLRCSRAHRSAGCGHVKLVRRSILERIVFDALRTNLMAPDLVAEFIREVHAEVNRQRSQVHTEKAALESRLKKVEQQLEGLITAISEGLRGPGIQGRLDALEAEKATLRLELQNPQTALVLLHPNLAEMYQKKVQALEVALSQPDQRDEAFAILRSLIERVEVKQAADGLEVELIGDIASMVELAENKSKNAAPGGTAFPTDLRRSVKVVAGARFELTTFRL